MTDDEGLRGDLRWRSIPALLRSAAESHVGRDAVVDAESGVTLTYDALRREADDTARALIGAGISPGDRVAIWAPNIWEWPVVLLGLQSAGAVLVPLNTRFKGAEAAHILAASGARVLFCVEGFLGNDYVSMLRASGAALPRLDHIVVLRGDPPDGTSDCPSFLRRGDDVDLTEVDRRVEALAPDTLADLLFTSGTTGAPKGVMCTHGQTLRAFADWADVVGLRGSDRYLVVNPFFHAFGYKAGIVAAMTVGATLYPEAVFDVPRVMEAIERHAITMLPGPPTLYQTILNHPDHDRSKLTSLRLAVTGAAVIPVELIARMRDTLGFEHVITGYGLTEACGIATMCRHDDDIETVALTSGRAIPGVEVRVVDPTGEALAPGEPGEVVVRGYNVMLGYFEAPELTAETVDADGWLHTGDIGVLDEAGYLRITDRIKDMFIVGGFNVYPAEVENLLLAHPDVAQVAVVGVPDARLGEVGCAFVVPALGSTPSPDAIVAWARERMANYKVPREVRVVDALPTNASGKVVKFELRAAADGGGST